MKSAAVIFILTVLTTVQVTGERLKETLVKEFDVKPNKRYKLTFKAQTADTGSRWELRILNKQGEMLYSGYFKKKWQSLFPERQQYQHSFLTPCDGVKLQFISTFLKSSPIISEVKLQEINSKDLVINGDFDGGRFDYSGWNDCCKAKLTEKDGKTVLEIGIYGYALSDPVPVIPGQVYTYPSGKDYYRHGEILFYDRDMLRISQASAYHHKKNRTFKIPAQAAYARFLLRVKHTHLGKALTIKKIGFIPVKSGEILPQRNIRRASDEIILAVNSDMREVRAARELQHWVREITGKRMSILTKPSSAGNTKIYLGTAWAKQFADDLKYLAGTDGFAVRRKGHGIYIFGAKPAGALFGVARFLELNTDIIWARPHKDFGTVFSKKNNIKFTHTSFRSRPVFTMRSMSFSGGLPMTDTLFWQERNAVNSPANFSKGFHYQEYETGALTMVGGGILDPLFKIDKFECLKRKHPDFFPWIDGKRMIRERWINPCFSNPGVVKSMVKGLRKDLKAAPYEKIDLLLCFQSDTWRVCACPKCMKPIKLPNGKMLAPKSPYSEKDPLFFSTRMFMMFNKVIKSLVKDYPDLKLMTHAYLYAAEAPAIKVHPAIKPQFAAYPTRTLRYPLLDGKNNGRWGDVWEKRFRKWQNLHANRGLSFFGYYYPAGFSAVADAAAADMSALAASGGYGVHNESYPDVEYPNKYTGAGKPYSHNWDTDAMERWVIARLMWNPNQNPEKLRQYYINRTFREAAPEMSKFFKLVSKSWHDQQNKMFVNCHTSSRDLFENFIVKPGLEKQARAILCKAKNAAVHPNSQMMIQRILSRFDSLGSTLGRHFVPFVPEASHDWNDPVSPHWEKAVKFDDFKLVDDWRVFNKAKAQQQTEVSIMGDKKNLYFRVIAFDTAPDKIIAPAGSKGETFPNGDRIEIILRINARNSYYFAVGPNGIYYSKPRLQGKWQVKTSRNKNSWTALIAIPATALKLDVNKLRLELRLGRVFRLKGKERKESSFCGASIYNAHKSFWTNLKIEQKGK